MSQYTITVSFCITRPLFGVAQSRFSGYQKRNSGIGAGATGWIMPSQKCQNNLTVRQCDAQKINWYPLQIDTERPYGQVLYRSSTDIPQCNIHYTNRLLPLVSAFAVLQQGSL